jgi:hypothetical protein
MKPLIILMFPLAVCAALAIGTKVRFNKGKRPRWTQHEIQNMPKRIRL